MSRVLNMSGGGAQEAPVITVSSSGLITATAGDEKTTKQLSTQAAKTVTPGASEQTVVASGKYTTGAVTVEGDSNLSETIMPIGYSCFGVEGHGAGCCCGKFLAQSKYSASFEIHEWTNTPSQKYARVRAVFIADDNCEVKQAYFTNSLSSTATTLEYIDYVGMFMCSDNYFKVNSASIDVVIGDASGFTFNTSQTYYFVVIYDGLGSYSKFA